MKKLLFAAALLLPLSAPSLAASVDTDAEVDIDIEVKLEGTVMGRTSLTAAASRPINACLGEPAEFLNKAFILKDGVKQTTYCKGFQVLFEPTSLSEKAIVANVAISWFEPMNLNQVTPDFYYSVLPNVRGAVAFGNGVSFIPGHTKLYLTDPGYQMRIIVTHKQSQSS